MIFLLLICACQAYSHTTFYLKTGENNEHYQYFHPATFGMDIYSDPLRQITSNGKFREYVNINIPCTGKWCMNHTILGSKFMCPKYGTDCLHVEHIIDLGGPEFEECPKCKNIVGNMVMAYGRWNSALGGLARSKYYDAQYEKSLIYGPNRINRAKQLIEQCCTRGQRRETAPVYDEFCDGDTCDCDGDSVCGCDCATDTHTVELINIVTTITIISCVTFTACIGWALYDGLKICYGSYKINLLELRKLVKRETAKCDDHSIYYTKLLTYIDVYLGGPWYRLSQTTKNVYLTHRTMQKIIKKSPVILNFARCFERGNFNDYLDKSCLDCELLLKIVVDPPRHKKLSSLVSTTKYMWLTPMEISVNELEPYDYCFVVKNFNGCCDV
jgi:hypothetical protein